MPDTIASLKRKLVEGETAERCGLVLKSGRVMEGDNVHQTPERGFIIETKFARRHMKNMVGTWHTHPNQKSVLSEEDYIGFGQWPGYTHYVIGTDGVRGYVAGEDGLIEEVSFAPN